MSIYSAVNYVDLELRVIELIIIRANRKARRLPARKLKSLYGKHKKPYTVIHDCITYNGDNPNKGMWLWKHMYTSC